MQNSEQKPNDLQKPDLHKASVSRRTYSKDEAISLMRQGKLITHRYFTADEFMTMMGGQIILEDGVRCSPHEFWRWRTDKCWDDGYSLYGG